MIEVEKKFPLNEGDEEKLIAGAEFMNERVFTDVYYDDARYSLTKKDTWLRRRGERYELKVPLNDTLAERVTDQYEELETEAEIASFLGLNAETSFEATLRDAGYEPFCEITTTRKKYRREPFIVDIDSVDFGYRIAEIELMVNSKEEIRTAADKILAFGKGLGLSEGLVRGKVAEFLRREKPLHFQALVDANVLKK